MILEVSLKTKEFEVDFQKFSVEICSEAHIKKQSILSQMSAISLVVWGETGEIRVMFCKVLTSHRTVSHSTGPSPTNYLYFIKCGL